MLAFHMLVIASGRSNSMVQPFSADNALLVIEMAPTKPLPQSSVSANRMVALRPVTELDLPGTLIVRCLAAWCHLTSDTFQKVTYRCADVDHLVIDRCGATVATTVGTMGR